MPGPGMEIVDDREVKEVLDVLEGRWLNRYGDPRNKRFKAKVFTFEGKFARYSKVRYCVATSSGTSALLCALAALGVGPGDEVIVPGYTYIASVSSIISFGALPVLAEIDETLNLDPRDVEAKITARTKAVMIVHMLGNPARLDELLAVARKHKLPVIEDACQACGAKYRGRPVGSLGDLGAFSFNMFKTITAGDGGAVITNSRKLYAKAFAYHDQGHKPLRTGVEVGARSMIGLDFRMNEVTGAILIAQLAKLDRICRTLRRNKSRLKKAIEPALRSKGFGFRHVTDPKGECGTLLTIIGPTTAAARKLGKALGAGTVDKSGWHVYNNWEHVMSGRLASPSNPYPFRNKAHAGRHKPRRGMLPRTDDILSRAINISIGVMDPGLGSAFGVQITDSPDVIDRKAEEFVKILSRTL